MPVASAGIRYPKPSRIHAGPSTKRRRPRHRVYGDLGARYSALDLKAKLLNCSLVNLLGAAREGVAAYGSGGFTTYSNQQLAAQLSAWAAEGLKSVKMKIGAQPAADLERVRAAREAIGAATNLFVDANGAYDARQAIAFAKKFEEFNVSWQQVSDAPSPRTAHLRFTCISGAHLQCFVTSNTSTIMPVSKGCFSMDLSHPERES